MRGSRIVFPAVRYAAPLLLFLAAGMREAWSAEEQPAAEIDYQIVQRPLSVEERRRLQLTPREPGVMNCLQLRGTPEALSLGPSFRTAGSKAGGFALRSFRLHALTPADDLLHAEWETYPQHHERQIIAGFALLKKQADGQYAPLLTSHFLRSLSLGWEGGCTVQQTIRYDDRTGRLAIHEMKIATVRQYEPFPLGRPAQEPLFPETRPYYQRTLLTFTDYEFAVGVDRLIPKHRTISLSALRLNTCPLEELNDYLLEAELPMASDLFQHFPCHIVNERSFTYPTQDYAAAAGRCPPASK